ncbi:stage II sporulation protein M [Methanobrevibacter sp.]
MLDVKREIKSAFAENKMAIAISTAILIVFLLIGFFLAPQLDELLNPVVNELANKVHSGEIQVSFQSIFSNNIRVVFLSFLFGALFGFSALILAFNGLFVGYFTAIQNDFFNTLLLLLPHGIFELPACVIACASGFVLFHFILRFFKSFVKNENGSITSNAYMAYVDNFDKLKQAIMLLAVASILMVIAGIVEVYLTVAIADFIHSIIG